MIDLLIVTLLLSLTSYQLTNLLVVQDGPFFIFLKIRLMFGVFETEDAIIVDDNNKFNIFDYNLFGNILSCQYCTSVWVTIFVWCIMALIINIDNIWLALFAGMGLTTITLDFKMREK